jgi:hypothetical protein
LECGEGYLPARQACVFDQREFGMCGILNDVSVDSAAPDPVGLMRGECQAATRYEVGAAIASYAPDAAWALLGLGTTFTFVDAEAIRGVAADPTGSGEEFGIDNDEILDPGNEVALRVSVQDGRLAGSTDRVRYRPAHVSGWSDGKVVRLTGYPEVKKASVAAKRLAGERG